jgi:hypothetical protein
MGLLYTSPQYSRLPIQLRIRAPGVPGLPARKTRLARAQEKAAAVPKRSVKAAIPLIPRRASVPLRQQALRESFHHRGLLSCRGYWRSSYRLHWPSPMRTRLSS